MSHSSDPVVLVHHDRPDHADGVRLAIASLRRHLPTTPILVSVPGARCEMLSWLTSHGCVEFSVETPFSGWNAKPALLLSAIERVNGSVVWMDADIICASDPRRLWAGTADEFLTTEDPSIHRHRGSREKTLAWGLDVGRELSVTVNSSVIKASPEHVELLAQWQAMLLEPEYTAAQQSRWYERPVHLMGDQEALTALLGSSDCKATKIRLLTNGTDIAHCFTPAAFPVGARLRSISAGVPPLVHSPGAKPWQHRASWPYQGSQKARLRAAYQDVHLRLSPYSVLARQLSVDAGISTDSFSPMSGWERGLLRFGERWPAVPEVPLAIAEMAGRRLAAGRLS